MFIELVDALRCPVPHEEGWLVAASTRMEARHIVEGTLGCPVCSAEYPVRDGVVDFRQRRGTVSSAPPGDPDVALRLAALLSLTDGQGFALLLGGWGAHAAQLAALVETPLVLVDPPADVPGAPGISVIRCDGTVPVAPTSARAMALDERDPAAVRCVRPGGRVVARASVSLPPDVRELARDDAMWVGERTASAPDLVTLHVRRGPFSRGQTP